MKIKVVTTDDFEKSAKPLRKYASLKLLSDTLKVNPSLGTPLGGNTFKIRLAIKIKRKGKSGGAIVITYLDLEVFVEIESEEEFHRIFLLEIYDKSEKDSISSKEIQTLINNRLG